MTAHQPVYLPWLGLFHKIALADCFVSFDGVQYLPKDWNNRNRIKTSAGPAWLTVPVLTSGHRDKPIRDIEINNQVAWRRKHWRSLLLNYGSAPHFGALAGFFEDVYAREWRYLCELNEHMLRWFLKTLGIQVRFLRASEMKLEGTKSDLVLDMCLKMEASCYVFGALGQEYANVAEFEARGVKAIFQDYRHPVYPQSQPPFVSHLSIVDLLFNCGEASLDCLMSGNIERESLVTASAS